MNKKTKKRRRSSAVIAVVAAVALLVGGTFAWQSISQKALNNTTRTPEEPGARLHDDFLDTQDFLAGGNKDVYVENYSGQNPDKPEEVGRPVYVRVRLAEYMEIGTGAGLFKVDPIVGDPIEYQNLDQYNQQDPLNPSATPTPGRTKDDANIARPVLTGTPADPTGTPSILDVSTWNPHIPGPSVEDDGTELHYYWEWDMGGSKVFMPTFNKDNESLLSERTDDDHTEYAVGATETATASYAGGAMSSSPEVHTAKSTLVTAAVITMEDWIDLGKPLADASGNGYWVGDEDGWFYWSKALLPSDATGLLLNGITTVEEPIEQYYYAIHVTSQMASDGAWGDAATSTGFYADGLTANALDLLNRAANLTPSIRSVQITEGARTYVRAGDSITLHADVNVKNPSGDPNETLVTWSSDIPATLGSDGKLTTTAADTAAGATACKVYTITATTAALPTAKTDSIKVVVIPENAIGVVAGDIDGKQYVDYGDNTYQEIANDGTLSARYRYSGADKKIGNGDDQYVTVNTSGAKLLGPDANDGSYMTVGADNKLGTADDEKRWGSPDENNLAAYPLSNVAVGETYKDMAGVEWIVLKDDGAGHKLVISKYVHGYENGGTGTRFNTTNVFDNLDSGTNLLKSKLVTFYSNNVGGDIRATSQAYDVLDDVRHSPEEPGGATTVGNNAIAHVNPGTEGAETDGGNVVFVGSYSEHNAYSSAYGSVATDPLGNTRGYWLRSPADAPSYRVYAITGGGTYIREYAINVYGYRPMLWVKS